MMSPILTLNKAYALIIDQENQRTLASSVFTSLGLIEGTSLYSHKSNTYASGTGTSKVLFLGGSGVSGGGYSGASTSGGSYANNSVVGRHKAKKHLLICDHCGCRGHSRDQC